MASIMELLEALNTEEAAVSTADLATKLKASKEGTLKQLTREKGKGNVDGNSQDGWLITDAGRKALEKGEIHPSMIDEGVTPRQQFEAIGQRIGITQDRIVLATDIVWSADYEDVIWVWKALEQADIRVDLRRVWVNSWRAKLQKGIPPELEAMLITPEVKKGGESETGEARKEEGRSYILVDDLPTYVGKGLGDLLYHDAVDLARIRAARAARSAPSAQGAPGQQQTADDIIKIVNAVREWSGDKGASAKSYVVTQGEEGAIVKEVEQGKPIVLNPPAGPRSKTYVVDGNEVRELNPGEPIVLKERQPAPPTKTFIVRQTAEGITTEEYDMSKPIIINAAPPSAGSNLPPMLPFPVMGSDGQPVYDKDGKPVYANIEPMMKWMGFQSEQKREDERHGALMGLAQAVRENIGDGIAAIKAAAEEAKKGAGAKKSASEQPQAYECSDCHTQFSIPDVPFETIKCPNPKCGRVYTKEEVMSA